MLTDIFARRYETVPLWQQFTEPSRKLLNQTFQLVEQIVPFYQGSKEYQYGTSFWTQIHDLLARELGVKELSPKYSGFYNPQQQWVGITNSVAAMCEKWMLAKFDGTSPADVFVKERLSFVEIAFRTRESAVAEANRKLPEAIGNAGLVSTPRGGSLRLPGITEEFVRAGNTAMNTAFQNSVEELNTRLRQAGCELHYHNGFIQIATDELTTAEIEAPFWSLVAAPKWKNVDHDLKEAFDLRDTDGRDPALYAAKALESAIKIISDDKKLTQGKERGAANYIDNLKRGAVIADWEAEILKTFFSKVRNPLGHGPGADPMPGLSHDQTTWAIETCMSWLKTLILRGQRA